MRALNVAATGMTSQMHNIDNTANNLANAGTYGFKRGMLTFHDLIYQTEMHSGGTTTANGNFIPVSIQYGTGVAVESVVKNFTQGELEETGKELDLAIGGNGFFKIALPDGTVAYTRAGNFQIDASSNNIVTSMGYVLNGDNPISLPTTYKRVQILTDGTVNVFQDGDNRSSQIGTIQLYTFVNKEGLEAIGNNLYIETDASGTEEQVLMAGTGGGSSSLKQGYLEGSNVQPVQAVVDLIKGQRIYEMNAKVMSVSDKMLEDITNAKA